jgi:hypothetical protein
MADAKSADQDRKAHSQFVHYFSITPQSKSMMGYFSTFTREVTCVVCGEGQVLSRLRVLRFRRRYRKLGPFTPEGKAIDQQRQPKNPFLREVSNSILEELGVNLINLSIMLRHATKQIHTPLLPGYAIALKPVAQYKLPSIQLAINASLLASKVWR